MIQYRLSKERNNLRFSGVMPFPPCSVRIGDLVSSPAMMICVFPIDVRIYVSLYLICSAWEQQGQSSRAALPDNISERWQKHILKMCDEVDFPIEEIYRTMYAFKPDLERQQVQKIPASLIPCRENAFLFNKRYHD